MVKNPESPHEHKTEPRSRRRASHHPRVTIQPACLNRVGLHANRGIAARIRAYARTVSLGKLALSLCVLGFTTWQVAAAPAEFRWTYYWVAQQNAYVGGLHIDFFAARKADYKHLVDQVGAKNVAIFAGGKRCSSIP